jgi:flavin reductase (DIM6/NTAB) family NADH-FMN oxidoreductase RutF
MSPDQFKDVRILDNFYQTSSYFPMPVVLVSTVAETGQTNLGPYSLCFPYRIAGKGRRSMKLNARASSNTAQNILRTGVCAINFIPDKKKYLKNCVMLGFPGETTEEKMKNSIFTLLPSMRTDEERKEGVTYPEIVDEAIQVFECSVDPESPPWIDEETEECHMILIVDKIIMKEKWKKALIEGKKKFPRLPIDYGYRNNRFFWFAKHKRPFSETIPKGKGSKIGTVMYAANRCDPEIVWDEEACAKITGVPRIFLGRVIQGVVDEAKKEGVTRITSEFMDKVRDKRSKEKEE